MSAPASCPDRARLEQLLDPQTPDNQQTELIGHLDGCEGCQHALEQMARGAAPWPAEIRDLARDQPPTQSAFWPALARLEQDLGSKPSTVEVVPPTEVSIDFLRPGEDPNSLGLLGHFEVAEVI